MSNTVAQINCSIITSDYKWLSKTLKAAQQQSAVRPYYECRIIDDRLVPDTLSTITTPKQGSIVKAPDGNILGVGLDTNNHVGFWKGTAAHLAASPDSVLDTDANALNSKNHYAISVSDYILGTYKIDVYFFGSFNTGNLSIKHYASYDGGVTWSSAQTVNATTIVHTSTLPLSIAAGKPYQNDNGQTISTVFYVEVVDGGTYKYQNICYQQTDAFGAFQAEQTWTGRNINSKDWLINGIDCAYIKGHWYIVFSGYHQTLDPVNQNTSVQNYSLYITKIVFFHNSSALQYVDVWAPADVIISALSSSTQNKNSFTIPQMTYVEDLKSIFLVFSGVVVYSIVSVNGATNVQTKQNFYLSQSQDFVNFTYPQPLIFNDGASELQDSYSNSIAFVTESGNMVAYIAGDGQLGKMLKKNVVADVSNDVLTYETNDSFMNPSTSNVDIGNQNNQWYAGDPSPNPGSAAIIKNGKVALFQGFYNANGIAELAPKNTYLIDDIRLNITSNRNDFNLLGRDLYKNLQVLKTKFAYNFTGIKKYFDPYDGSTLDNYNQVTGTWSQGGGNFFTALDEDSLAIFTSYLQEKSNTIFSIVARLPASLSVSDTDEIDIYPYYVDSSTFVRLRITINNSTTSYNWRLSTFASGIENNEASGSFSTTALDSYVPIVFNRYNYTFFEILIGQDYTSNGNSINALNSPVILASAIDCARGMGVDTLNFMPRNGNIALGCANITSSQRALFTNFKYMEFDTTQNLEELVQTIATKSGIFDYKMPNTFADYFFDDLDYTGGYSLVNRNMQITQGNTVYRTGTYDNAEIKFRAKASYASSHISFQFIFRRFLLAGQECYYSLSFEQASFTNQTDIRLFLTVSGVTYQLSIIDHTIISPDLRQFNEFRVIFFDSYIFLAINNQIVMAWYDNNVSNNTTPVTSGQIGFKLTTGTLMVIDYVVASELWNEIENFSLNPGDDLENSIEGLLETIRAYFFSDLMGRFKVLKLNTDDPSTYTYENQLISQIVDNSDKEYINQVTVIGLNNITATARDNTLISEGGMIRELVINDNKVTTYTDALTRANFELVNANKYNNQYNGKQVVNVGSEIYDVITMINTGDNSSNVDQVVRNYSQDTKVGGYKLNYWMQLESGTL